MVHCRSLPADVLVCAVSATKNVKKVEKMIEAYYISSSYRKVKGHLLRAQQSQNRVIKCEYTRVTP